MSTDSSYSQDWEKYGKYSMWVNAFRSLAGSPTESVAEKELRSQLAGNFHIEGKPEHNPKQAVPIEMAVDAGILTRNPVDGTLQLAAVVEIGLEVGGEVRIHRGKPESLQLERSVTVQQI